MCIVIQIGKKYNQNQNVKEIIMCSVVGKRNQESLDCDTYQNQSRQKNAQTKDGNEDQS